MSELATFESPGEISPVQPGVRQRVAPFPVWAEHETESHRVIPE